MLVCTGLTRTRSYRTKLSKALITDPAKIEWRSPADLKTKYGVDLRTGVQVEAVDAPARSVRLTDGTTVPYETLVLATGGLPRRLPIEGANLSTVYTMRGIDDAKKIDAGTFFAPYGPLKVSECYLQHVRRASVLLSSARLSSAWSSSLRCPVASLHPSTSWGKSLSPSSLSSARKSAADS